MTTAKQQTNKPETKTTETAAQAKPQTEANKIWNEIKNNKINIFGLEGMTVGKYCAPVNLNPERCFMKFTASAAVPAVEEAVQGTYDFEVAGQYIIVSRKK